MESLSATIELQPDPGELRRMRAFVESWAVLAHCNEEERFRATLVATEAVTNAIRHGRRMGSEDRGILVSCGQDHGELVIEVTDRGRFREAQERPDDDGGRGLFLIRELTRGFELETGADGTHLSMRLGTPHLAMSAA